MRSSEYVLLYPLIDLLCRRGISGPLILRAVFGKDTARFGGMMGLFSFL